MEADNNQQKVNNLKHPVDIENNQEINNFIVNYTRTKKVKGLKVQVANTNFYHKQLKKTRLLLDVPKYFIYKII